MISSFRAGINAMNIRIIMKFKTITSVDGVEPLNSAAKITEKIIMYIIAIDAMITMYENIFSQIEERLRVRYLRIV